VLCGPWLRTQGEDDAFDPELLAFLIDTADKWGMPFVVNTESAFVLTVPLRREFARPPLQRRRCQPGS